MQNLKYDVEDIKRWKVGCMGGWAVTTTGISVRCGGRHV